MSKRRVVVTGLGAVSPLGHDLATTWDRLLAGESGAAEITEFDASNHPCRIACEVKNFDGSKYFDKLELRRLDIYSQYGLVAANEAMEHSGIDVSKEDPTRIACILGTGIGGIHETEDMKMTFESRGPGRVSPFFIPKMMANALAGQVSIRYGLQGTSLVTSSACASSGHALGIALREVRDGYADVVVTGGSEAAMTGLAMGGFASMKALSTRNDDPTRASRPFDKDRDGFVLGSGASVLVFEELERAKKRGATIYAEVVGFGSTDDAFHITAPQDSGDGAVRAIQLALQDGGIRTEQVGYVNAHGTSTPLNDKIESLALRKAFGAHADKLQVSSTKSMVGHLLGASGALELTFCALALKHGVLPPTINYETPDPDCDLDYVPNTAREVSVEVAISNSLGFGGHNTCLALRRFDG
jgi:3-oxoacyl-[acyl-carrier-protein] synthase II